jgi:arginine/lysine/ornithine decarboxylase
VSSIKEAQELAAQAFGSDESLFLVNGSTSGVTAAILGVCSDNEEIIINRNMHQSVVAGLIFSGAKPVYILPEYDKRFRMFLSVTPKEIERVVKAHPKAKAVLITNPTQFGVTADLKKIAGIVHKAGKILIVDEAWGAHFNFHPSFPPSAISSGADIAVQSAHKRLPVLSQTSLIHFKGNRVDREKVKNAVRMLQTTSPSYILLTSIDLARRQMALEGKVLWNKAIELVKEAKVSAKKAGLEFLERDYLKNKGFDLDVSFLTLAVKNGFDGWKILNKHRIEPEFASLNQIVLIFGIGNDKKDISLLHKVLKAISPLDLNEKTWELDFKPEVVFSPRQAYLKSVKKVKLENAVGKISAELIVPYPPGIPLLVPGEVITEKIVSYLKELTKYSSGGMNILGGGKELKIIA